MAPKFDYVWVIAYIDRDHIHRVESDLLNNDLGSIRVYIPTVRVLKKQFKNKNIYEYIPLLFNYGFFQIPYDKACDPSFLRVMKERIPAIYGWVLDPARVIKSGPKLRFDNRGKMVGSVKVATATEEEIVRLLKVAEKSSLFSDGVVDRLQVGDFLTLKGYPYDGMAAEIVNIDKVKKQVKIRLLLETMITTTMVSFDNIFYTVYSNFEETLKERSLDEIEQRGKRSLDRLYAKVIYESG